MGNIVFSNMGNVINNANCKWFKQKLRYDAEYYGQLVMSTLYEKHSKRVDEEIKKTWDKIIKNSEEVKRAEKKRFNGLLKVLGLDN